MMPTNRLAILVVLAMSGACAHAATVYRCDAGGRVVYTDRPCDGASAITKLNTPPPKPSDTDPYSMGLRAKIEELKSELPSIKARECQGLEDSLARRESWLSDARAVGLTATNGTEAEIRILRRKITDAHCP